MAVMLADELEPPHGIICRHFRQGEVVPFLGAGASLGVRPADKGFDGNKPAFLPNGAELSEWLAQECNFPEAPATDLAKVASYFQVRASREVLTDYLRGVFQLDFPSGPIHEMLADMPKPMLIVTTNYDDLIENAFRARGKPYHLVTYPESEDLAGSILWWKPGAETPEASTPSDLPLKVDDVSIIYKMHGSVVKSADGERWDSFVITEEDYVHFLSRMTQKGGAIPARFMLHLRNSALLFLGYGLRDWNLRVMLDKLRRPITPVVEDGLHDADRVLPAGRANEKPAWAIQHKPSRLERVLWEARKVQIFDQDLNGFADEIRKRM